MCTSLGGETSLEPQPCSFQISPWLWLHWDSVFLWTLWTQKPSWLIIIIKKDIELILGWIKQCLVDFGFYLEFGSPCAHLNLLHNAWGFATKDKKSPWNYEEPRRGWLGFSLWIRDLTFQMLDVVCWVGYGELRFWLWASRCLSLPWLRLWLETSGPLCVTREHRTYGCIYFACFHCIYLLREALQAS